MEKNCKLQDFPPSLVGFEQLSSSIGWRVMAWGGTNPRLAFVGIEFLPILFFEP